MERIIVDRHRDMEIDICSCSRVFVEFFSIFFFGAEVGYRKRLHLLYLVGDIDDLIVCRDGECLVCYGERASSQIVGIDRVVLVCVRISCVACL